MDAYIAAVLKEVYLPQAVKDEVKAQLKRQLSQAEELGESQEHLMRRLGLPEEVAERYNRNYRKALQKRFRLVNLGISALIAAMLLAGSLAVRELYSFTKDRVMWYQFQLYQSQMSPIGGGSSGQGWGVDAFGGSPGSAGRSQQIQPFSPLQPTESAFPTTTINLPLIILCAAAALLCTVVINHLIVLKTRWKGYTLYFPPSIE